MSANKQSSSSGRPSSSTTLQGLWGGDRRAAFRIWWEVFGDYGSDLLHQGTECLMLLMKLRPAHKDTMQPGRLALLAVVSHCYVGLYRNLVQFTQKDAKRSEHVYMRYLLDMHEAALGDTAEMNWRRRSGTIAAMLVARIMKQQANMRTFCARGTRCTQEESRQDRRRRTVPSHQS